MHSGNQLPGVEKRLDSWTKPVLTPPEPRAGPINLAWVRDQGTQQMPAQGFSQKQAAAPSVTPLQFSKIQHNSWKFQPQMPLVFAFQIVYLRCVSLTHSSPAVLAASPATGAKGRQKSQPPGREWAM